MSIDAVLPLHRTAASRRLPKVSSGPTWVEYGFIHTYQWHSFLLTIQKGPANGSFYLFPCPYWYALQGRRTALRTAIRHVLLEHQSDASYSLRSREADALFRISIFHIFFLKRKQKGGGRWFLLLTHATTYLFCCCFFRHTVFCSQSKPTYLTARRRLQSSLYTTTMRREVFEPFEFFRWTTWTSTGSSRRTPLACHCHWVLQIIIFCQFTGSVGVCWEAHLWSGTVFTSSSFIKIDNHS